MTTLSISAPNQTFLPPHDLRHPSLRLPSQRLQPGLLEPPEQLAGVVPRPHQPLQILGQAREAELRKAGLPDAEDVSGAADLQVRLGDLEAVGGPREDRQAALRLGGQLFVEGEAERRTRAPADPAAQLVELGEAETLGALQDHAGRL